MSFWHWYVRRGRIDRRTWWLHYTLPLTGLALLAFLADLTTGAGSLPTAAQPDLTYGPLFTVVGLLSAPASISSNVTRLHDRGLPAWLLLLALVPVVGQLGLLVLTGFVPGHRGVNRYGPPPSAPGPQPAAEPLYPPPSWS
ncbi:DUF805 domain-containing protein [Modestobacter marinus]|uniref:DUF805 domain-containing protein n=1 Tax=Modestobacter marinus TaxID=477641 RepID=UPI001C96711B|nr:DUF805 domain-containing protein [Modestobacter marinus]